MGYPIILNSCTLVAQDEMVKLTATIQFLTIRPLQILWTHSGRNKLDTILQTLFSNAYFWMEIYFDWSSIFFNENVFWLKLQQSLFLSVEFVNTGPGNDLAASRWVDIIWTNDDLVYWYT